MFDSHFNRISMRSSWNCNACEMSKCKDYRGFSGVSISMLTSYTVDKVMKLSENGKFVSGDESVWNNMIFYCYPSKSMLITCNSRASENENSRFIVCCFRDGHMRRTQNKTRRRGRGKLILFFIGRLCRIFSLCRMIFGSSDRDSARSSEIAMK